MGRMDDLISRQEVMRLINNMTVFHPDTDKSWKDGYNIGRAELYDMITVLPSALAPDTNVGSKGDMIYRQDAIHVVSGLDSSFVKYIEELPPAKPEPLTEAEIIICKLYLDDLDKYKTCNEYKLLMGLLDGTASAQPEPCEDCVSRTSVIRLLHSGYHGKSMIEEVKELPPAKPEIKPIDYQDCANAMFRMWMDNVVTDGEYNRIMDKLNAFWRAKHE